MSWQEWLTITVILATVVVLVKDLAPPSLTILGGTTLLLVSGVIDVQQAFSGFSNPAPITIGALYVLARAVDKTGAIQPLVTRTLGENGSQRGSLARLLIPTAGASAFLNNTPIVAMMIPQVTNWADRVGLSPSRFLIPLSYAAVLGGTVTAIGTATNLVISGLLEAHGFEPLGMFEITAVGLPIVILGILLIVFLAPILLPERIPARRDWETSEREFVVNMEVVRNGPLDGVSVEDGRLRNLQGVFLAEISRQGEVIAPVAPQAVLKGGDLLTFVGKADLIVDLQSMNGLQSVEQKHLDEFDTSRHTFFEAVIGPASPLVGRTLKEIGFRSKYQAAVVAIHRAGHRVSAKFGEVGLRVGDNLILLTDPGFRDRWRDRRDFLLVSKMGGVPPSVSRKSGIVGIIAAGVVVCAASGLMPILHAALLAGILLILFGVLTPGEARGSVDFDVIIVIAAAFGLGAAVEVTGLAERIALVINSVFSFMGPRGVLLGLVLSTVLLRELITNNAAAVLLFPIAVSMAVQLGLDPRPFAMGVALAAATTFLSPIGYQTNIMVYGPGGYRYTDYFRLGLPLTIMVVTAIVLLVPFAWPF